MDSFFIELVKTLQAEQRQAKQRANELLDMPDYMAYFYWSGKAKALADTIQQIKRMEKKGTAGWDNGCYPYGIVVGGTIMYGILTYTGQPGMSGSNQENWTTILSGLTIKWDACWH